jgi:hypothetical protein
LITVLVCTKNEIQERSPALSRWLAGTFVCRHNLANCLLGNFNKNHEAKFSNRICPDMPTFTPKSIHTAN